MSTVLAPPPVPGDAAAVAVLRSPLAAWLRLLWNVTMPILHLGAQADGDAAPFLGEDGVYLPPPPFDPVDPRAGRWYGAAAAHAAAHVAFSRRVFRRDGTAPITQALIGVLEDARAEAMACRELPGLRRLWAAHHVASAADGDGFETLLLRLARALLDPGYDDPHPWVRKGRARFYLDDRGEVLAPLQPAALRTLASALGHDLGQMRVAFNLRLYRPGPGYRDDNRWLWQDEGAGPTEASRPRPLDTAARPSAGGTEAVPPESLAWRYGEWDRLIGQVRPAWSTVHQRRPASVVLAPAPANDPLLRHRLVAVLRKAASCRATWRRRARDGDDVEIDEVVRAAAEGRSGASGGERVHRRLQRAPRPMAAVLLIDCSASSNEAVDARGPARLATAQSAAGLLAAAMHAAGWSFAVHGFNSAGRHAVHCWLVKAFEEPWADAAAARLGALQGERSTRLGAALRHACSALVHAPADGRLLIAIGDGEAHDLDIHDPRYLVEDARHAVQAARRVGVDCVHLLTHPQDADEAHRIFGAARVGRLAGEASLPGVLARLLAFRR